MSLKIYSFNVNGIRAAARKGLFDWLRAESPDILCLQETKAWPEQLSREFLEVDGYESYWNWCAFRKGYSGVATYTRLRPAKVEKGFGPKGFDTEGRTLIMHYDAFTLYNVYFPNGQKDAARLKYKMDFYGVFLKHAKRLRRRGRHLLMCGDYNTAHREIDLARPRENEKRSGFLPEERAWIDTYIASGYTDTFRMFCQDGGQYTWWDMKTRARERNVGWRIDYFFVDDAFKGTVKDSFIMPSVVMSDHCPIGIELAV
jgi:exodeoxyribonuclease-3